MLVSERMTKAVITTTPGTPVSEALARMKREKIRRMPVIDDQGHLVGIVSDKDLLYASPSPVTSLSVWEVTYLMSKLKVESVMTRAVITVVEDTPLEDAARIMADAKIGGLPVVRGEAVVGIITETDLFKLFLELLGAREKGLRVTMLVRDSRGELAKITRAIADCGGSFISLVQFRGTESTNRQVMVKVRGIDRACLVDALSPIVLQIEDIREV